MKENNSAKVEIFLVALIAICMLTLINVSNSKLDEVSAGNDSILLRDNPDNKIEGKLAQEMIAYKLESCTMMETYDKNFNLIGRIPFVDGPQNDRIPDIREYKGLIQLFEKYPEGHTRIHIGDDEEDIYFRWTKTTRGEDVFVLIYMTRPVVKYLWAIPFLCYLILILIFILVVRLRMSCQRNMINYYHRTSVRVRDKMFNKDE